MGAFASASSNLLSSRLGALRHLSSLIRLVYAASPRLTVASLLLRLVQALLPVAMLYVGKLIIDEVVVQRLAIAGVRG